MQLYGEEEGVTHSVRSLETLSECNKVHSGKEQIGMKQMRWMDLEVSYTSFRYSLPCSCFHPRQFDGETCIIYRTKTYKRIQNDF